MNPTIEHLEQLQPYLCKEIPEVMPARYVQLVIIRQLESHAVFTTEGDDLVTRRVRAGRKDGEIVPRLMMSNRKVMATERRLGKETLRAMELASEYADDTCYLGKLCGKCIDCILCGFAARKDLGNMNSRVLTDEGWSLAARSGYNTDNVTFNAINERSRSTGQALGDVDMILPGTLFVNVTTLKGVTPKEFLYWLYCTHYTRRYGADASRIGKMRNYVVGLVGSYVEALSSLDLVQRFHDDAPGANDPYTLAEYADAVIRSALEDIKLKQHVHLDRRNTDELLTDFLANHGHGEPLKQLLAEANREAAQYAQKKSQPRKGEEEAEEVVADEEGGVEDGDEEA